ncbi:tyrosine-type recombinase/integrase [Nonomuraea sp. NPDC049152]|uniref:tyrosine-type recombinase/integrase n=1 Tax=Nonomuraea sp. NPDC049152 TaxID=3154350 RepID=UPI0033DA7801
MSYRRSAEVFEAATAGLGSEPWTLHQLRHSALTHAAEDGANTSTLLAYSGHTSVALLVRYTRRRWRAGRKAGIRPRGAAGEAPGVSCGQCSGWRRRRWWRR